jgi:CRP/FNR family transcriptional regulator
MTTAGTTSDFALDTLRRCALFARVDDAALGVCAASLRVRRFRRGETIFHQGDPGDSLFIVESGSVKIVLPSPEGEEGAIIATLGRGDFFGELALLDGAAHSATAVALEPTQALVLGRATFERLVDESPSLRHALFAGLVAELRRLTGHVEELHFLDLPGRLASRLVRIARDVDPAAAGEIRLVWPYTQSDLAAMIGGTRQTVNRLLNDLAERGLIRFEKDALVIPDLVQLEHAAQR